MTQSAFTLFLFAVAALVMVPGAIVTKVRFCNLSGIIWSSIVEGIAISILCSLTAKRLVSRAERSSESKRTAVRV